MAHERLWAARVAFFAKKGNMVFHASRGARTPRRAHLAAVWHHPCHPHPSIHPDKPWQLVWTVIVSVSHWLTTTQVFYCQKKRHHHIATVFLHLSVLFWLVLELQLKFNISNTFNTYKVIKTKKIFLKKMYVQPKRCQSHRLGLFHSLPLPIPSKDI